MDEHAAVAESERPFLALARGLYAVGHAIHCDESCACVHAGHGCEHEGHSCGCPYSERYEFDWFPSGDVAERWSGRAFASLLQFMSRLDCRALSVEEIEARLEWWWRGENRALRKAMEHVHRTRCERGRGVLVNRVTDEVIRARCKSWRDCSYCAWVYGRAVERLLQEVQGLRALVVFTMPRELGDSSDKAHIAAQAKAMHRLAERLYRKFGHRFASVWTREHNTKGEGPGRLHLNVLWDEKWVDQLWLSETARACGFGEVVHISRVRANGARRGECGALCDQVSTVLDQGLEYASGLAEGHAAMGREPQGAGANEAPRQESRLVLVARRAAAAPPPGAAVCDPRGRRAAA